MGNEKCRKFDVPYDNARLPRWECSLSLTVALRANDTIVKSSYILHIVLKFHCHTPLSHSTSAGICAPNILGLVMHTSMRAYGDWLSALSITQQGDDLCTNDRYGSRSVLG